MSVLNLRKYVTHKNMVDFYNTILEYFVNLQLFSVDQALFIFISFYFVCEVCGCVSCWLCGVWCGCVMCGCVCMFTIVKPCKIIKRAIIITPE